MTTVMEHVDLPASVTPSDTSVDVQLVGADGAPLAEAYDTAAGTTIVGHHAVALSATGTWSLDLAANSALTPAGTVWRRSLSGRGISTPGPLSYATVPAAGGPYRWDEILDDPPAAITATALAAHAADEDLHGGGQLLGYADRDTDFVTSSTSAVDVTGVTVTFTVPDRPYVVEIGSLVIIEEGIVVDFAGETFTPGAAGSISIALADDTQLGLDTARAQAGGIGDARFLNRRMVVPNHHHAPAVDSSITYKMRAFSSAVTSDLTLVAEFPFPVVPDAPYIVAYTL